MDRVAEPTTTLSVAPLRSDTALQRPPNERLVLSLLRQHGPLAKADIARASGLSAQTVSVLMRRLEGEGFLVKGDPVRGKVGQPSVPMALSPDGASFFGLKVGRRSVELALIDFNGAVRRRAMTLHAFPTPEGTLSFAEAEIDAVMSGLGPRATERIGGLGIATPFFLWNWAEKLGVPVAEMAGWREADLQRALAERYPFPVYLQNDGNAACSAEVVFGTGETPRDFLYFYIGYFIGGGVVLNGALYSGAGNAGALGPMPVPSAGGVRQLLDVASLSGLEVRLQRAGHDTAGMWQSAEAWALDDGILADWLDEAATGIAHAIAAACVVIDFGAVVIDGWLPRAFCKRLVDTVESQLAGMDLTGWSKPDVRMGTVGADARTLGAAGLPLSERFLTDTARSVL